MKGPLRPPPAGFSPESTIRIDREGRFWHDGQPVTHPGLARALASWVDIDESTGRFILRNTVNWCCVQVDDAPLVVVSCRPTESGFHGSLTDGSVEPVDLGTLWLGEGDVPYCLVREGRIPARFSQQAAFSLLEHAEPVGDEFFVLGRRLSRKRGEG
ncbi:MAG: DUF1285 domain-containing protein [Deltaproteobacteria bacterium]|nr:DUF1285 domain-containing protein [Deltaproteobacteria bacterium]